MTKEQIEQLALEAYPITPAYDGDEIIYHDINDELREGFIEGLQKALELLYTEEQVIDTFEKGEEYGREDMQYVTGRLSKVTALDKDEYLQSLKQQ